MELGKTFGEGARNIYKKGARALDLSAELALAACFKASSLAYKLTDYHRTLDMLGHYRNNPLEQFDPEDAHAAPYWQDLVLRDGRAEKLLERLSGLPQVNDTYQKVTLQYSKGGLAAHPAAKDLLKYGINDENIFNWARNISRTASTVSLMKEIDDNRDVKVALDPQKGLINADNADEILMPKNALTQPFLVQDAYADSGHEDAELIAQKVGECVLDWLAEDVSPAVPGIYFGGKLAQTNADGVITFKDEDRNENWMEIKGFELPPELKAKYEKENNFRLIEHYGIYEACANEYKGTWPEYDPRAQPPVAAAAPSPDAN